MPRAEPARCAADLLAQAEHGPDSEAILLTDDPRFPRPSRAVPGQTTSRSSWWHTRRGAGASEAYAPEHLELRVADPDALARRGPERGQRCSSDCSAVVGDYAAGATHVLPTGGLARGLRRARARDVPEAAPGRPARRRRACAAIVGPLARVEGLPLHAAAAGVSAAGP